MEPSWRNYLFELQNQAEHNTTNKQSAPDYLFAIMLVIFSTESNFCIISDYEQAKNFFNPANTQTSSEESFKEKRK